MCTGWCPLATDWGNVAEIISALATIAVGIAAFYISRAANKTASKLANLEIKREIEAETLRGHEQTLILVGMSGVMGKAYAALNACSQTIQREGVAEGMQKADAVRELFLKILRHGQFEIPESTRSRMHFIEPKLAAQILRTQLTIDRCILGIGGLAAISEKAAKFGVASLMIAFPQAATEAHVVFSACQKAQRDLGLHAAELERTPDADIHPTT